MSRGSPRGVVGRQDHREDPRLRVSERPPTQRRTPGGTNAVAPPRRLVPSRQDAAGFRASGVGPQRGPGRHGAPHRVYMAVVLADRGCKPFLINSVEDHVHLVFELGRTVAVSQAVEAVKSSSSKRIKTQGPEFATFAWQAGYGAFGVSESNVLAVRDYIADQREHHRKRSFEDEHRAFLERHGIAFDERYVWD